MTQIYGGLDSELLFGHPMQTKSTLPESLHEFICEYGAMEGLKSDNAKSETLFAMKDLLRMYPIKDQQSEPHYQHQNLIEWCIQDIKMNGTWNHGSCWLPHPVLAFVFIICYWSL